MSKASDKPFISSTEIRINRKDGPLGRSVGGIEIYAIPYEQLPRGAKQVLRDIAEGKDPGNGRVFKNAKGELPKGSYHEFNVRSPGRPVTNSKGSRNPGKRRIIASERLILYTPAHHDRMPKGVGSNNPRHARIRSQLAPELQHGTYVITGMPRELERQIKCQMKARGGVAPLQRGTQMPKDAFNTAAAPSKPVINKSTGAPPPTAPSGLNPTNHPPGLGGPSVGGPAAQRSAPSKAAVTQGPTQAPRPPGKSLSSNFNSQAKGLTPHFNARAKGQLSAGAGLPTKVQLAPGAGSPAKGQLSTNFTTQAKGPKR